LAIFGSIHKASVIATHAIAWNRDWSLTVV